MDKIKIEREALVLDEKEKQNLLQVLKYFKHGAYNHSCSGALVLNLGKFVDYMIENLEE